MKKGLYSYQRYAFQIILPILYFLVMVVSLPVRAIAQPPEPFVAIHVSELTQALETMPAVPPTPVGADTTGYQWWYTSWHYFVAYESIKEVLRSDGTPFVEVSDSDIAAGRLRTPDGLPRYPILISLTSEAIADNEIAPLRDYVKAGGFVVVGASGFTRYPDGTYRSDIALANEMGLRMANPNLSASNNWNWSENRHFTKTGSHRLTSHIPDGTLVWNGPFYADEIPWGVSPTYALHGAHWIWTVVNNGATVLANGDAGPLLAVRNYEKGQFIYHGAMQPLIGHGVIDPSIYSYLIYRKAIEWAFESFQLPVVKLSPWRYPYDAALLVRHDFEGNMDVIKTIKASAQYEHALGVSGDYYFCTGALRTYTGSDKATVISNMKDAVSVYGATIGSHNGGLRNPDASLPPSDEQYWHWGPDQALGSTFSGYASGKAYASSSIATSFQDIAGWLSGVDNGRAGCAATSTCPKNWASPLFNATNEDSRGILEQLGSTTMGEQKVGPFPHWSLSYNTPGKRFSHLSLPTSDWFVGAEIPQALDMGHTWTSIREAVDAYHGNGMLLNFYGHQPSSVSGLEQDYVIYGSEKPGVWSTNATGIYDWWLARSQVTVTPGFTINDTTAVMAVSVSGATDSGTAIELVLPGIAEHPIDNMTVYLNGAPAGTGEYRTTGNGIKIHVGTSVTDVKVQYPTQGVTVALSSLSLAPATVPGGGASQGTVTLSGAAPSSGVVISLSDNSSYASEPSSITVPGGSTSATFTVSTSRVYSTRTVTVSAAYGGITKTATLTITPAAVTLSALSLNPASVTGGGTSQGTVTLSGAAPSGGIVVSLSDNSSYASEPSSVTVPAGSTSATFTVTTSAVPASTSATISAAYGGVTRTAALTINPATVTLSSLSLTPATVRGGYSSQGKVTLSRAAPSGGIVVSLSDNSSYAGVPTSVTVPAGSTSATFTVTTTRVYFTRTVSITARYGGVTKTATLTITR